MHFIEVQHIGQYLDDEIAQNVYLMDLVNGIQFDRFICGELTTDEQLVQIIKQIVYVGIYMNLNGYYHMDSSQIALPGNEAIWFVL